MLSHPQFLNTKSFKFGFHIRVLIDISEKSRGHGLSCSGLGLLYTQRNGNNNQETATSTNDSTGIRMRASCSEKLDQDRAKKNGLSGNRLAPNTATRLRSNDLRRKDYCIPLVSRTSLMGASVATLPPPVPILGSTWLADANAA